VRCDGTTTASWRESRGEAIAKSEERVESCWILYIVLEVGYFVEFYSRDIAGSFVNDQDWI